MLLGRLMFSERSALRNTLSILSLPFKCVPKAIVYKVLNVYVIYSKGTFRRTK